MKRGRSPEKPYVMLPDGCFFHTLTDIFLVLQRRSIHGFCGSFQSYCSEDESPVETK
jgi:hypothetical protein